MNSFDHKRFFKEFPFLHTLGRKPEHCENIVVQRSSPELLHYTPEQCKIVGPQVDFAEGDEVVLFSQAGQPLGQVRATVTQRCQQQGEAPLRLGESILEAIYRLNLIHLVHYVVWVEYGQHGGHIACGLPHARR